MNIQLSPVSEIDESIALARIARLTARNDGLQWFQLLYRLQRGENRTLDRATGRELVALGLCEPGPHGPRLTEFGNKCATSAREYIFWIERGRRLHGEDQFAATRLDNFRDRDVLEIGPGCGFNLLSLGRVTRNAIGVEIEPVHIEFSRILSAREGVRAPCIARGSGERLPVRAETFDWIILWSVLQYMEVGAVFRECVRVLRPGGRVLIAHRPLPQFLKLHAGGAVADANRRLLWFVTHVAANTVFYQLCGKRLRSVDAGNATARPAYPTARFLRSLAARNGLRYRDDWSAKNGSQLLMVLEKGLATAEERPSAAA